MPSQRNLEFVEAGAACFSLNLEDEIERGSSGSKEKFVCSSVFLLIIKSPFWRVVTKTLSFSFKIWSGRDFVLNLLKLFWCLLYKSIPLSFITQTRFFSSTKIFHILLPERVVLSKIFDLYFVFFIPSNLLSPSSVPSQRYPVLSLAIEKTL